MNPKPLAYDSLRCVLQYLEPYKRIELFRQCPSITKTERIVPLFLHSLDFLKSGFKLNDTTYKIEIGQRYHVGNPPESVREHNLSGGFTMDLDSFGLKDGRYVNVLTPGDILIKEEL